MIKFCTYNPTSNFNIYLWNEVLLFEQPLYNHHARLSQHCNIVTTLQGCEHLHKCNNFVATLLQLYKVVSSLLQPIWDKAESKFINKIKLGKSTECSIFKIFVQSLETCMHKAIIVSNNTIIFVSFMVLDFLSQRQQKYSSAGSSFVGLPYSTNNILIVIIIGVKLQYSMNIVEVFGQQVYIALANQK